MLSEVVFDFDGSLADTFEQQVSLIREFKPGLNQEMIDIYRSNGARVAMKRLKLSLGEILRMATKIKNEQKKMIEEAKAFRGIKQLIVDLRERGMGVGILSSNSKENINRWLIKNGIEIDWVRSESTIFGKEKAIIKVKSENMVYVGDEVRDIEACHKIGVKIVAVTWGFNSKEALRNARADYLVDNSKELRNLLLSLSQ